jgi:hypothetical protein
VPGAIVTQTTVSLGALATAEAIIAHSTAVLQACRDEIRAAGGLVVLHDWRSIRSIDPGVRQRFTRSMANRAVETRGVHVVIAPSSRVLRMAVEAGNLFATVVLRSQVQVHTSANAALATLGIRPPAPGSRFPGT